jgi:hypothetical protein
LRTVGDIADGSSGDDYSTVRANSLKSNAATDADGEDANCPPRSSMEKREHAVANQSGRPDYECG